MWLLQASEFEAVCKGEGAPEVFVHDHADGIFLNSPTANSFGLRYLQEEGFKWFEAKSIYKRDGWVRYELSPEGKIKTTDIPALTAQFEVREVSSQPLSHTHLSETEVVDRATGQIIAKAGSAVFDGGWASAVLGGWGLRTCPSAMTDSAGFRNYYHLTKDALRQAR